MAPDAPDAPDVRYWYDTHDAYYGSSGSACMSWGFSLISGAPHLVERPTAVVWDNCQATNSPETQFYRLLIGIYWYWNEYHNYCKVHIGSKYIGWLLSPGAAPVRTTNVLCSNLPYNTPTVARLVHTNTKYSSTVHVTVVYHKRLAVLVVQDVSRTQQDGTSTQPPSAVATLTFYFFNVDRWQGERTTSPSSKTIAFKHRYIH